MYNFNALTLWTLIARVYISDEVAINTATHEECDK